MHSRAVVAAGSLLFLAAAAARADQRSVELTPRFAPGEPLTVVVRNLSKLPVRLTGAKLEFAAARAPGTPHCALSLPATISLGPAEMKTITLAANDDVMRCIGRTGVAASQVHRAFAITARDLAERRRRGEVLAEAALHPADLTYRLEIGKKASMSEKTTWHFAAE